MSIVDPPERSSDTSLIGIGLLVLIMGLVAIPSLNLALDRFFSLVP
jgi:hypothetical protein